MFDRLGVFVSCFTLDDAIAVAAVGDVDDVTVVDAVSVLVDKSLCTIEPRDGTTWYRYLEPIRAYAHGHLAIGHAAIEDTSTRHTAHFGRIAATSSTSSGAHARETPHGRRNGASRISERPSCGRPGTTSMTRSNSSRGSPPRSRAAAPRR